MQPCDRGLVSEPVPVDATAEEFEKLFETLPTVPGGVSVSREVGGELPRFDLQHLKKPTTDRTIIDSRVDYCSFIVCVGGATSSLGCLHTKQTMHACNRFLTRLG